MPEDLDPDIRKRLQEELAAMTLRVRDGNEKITAAWLMVQDFEDENKINQGIDKITAGTQKLRALCLNLKCLQEILEGEGQCLYILNKKKARPCNQTVKSPKGTPVETMCWVCPSAYPHWKEEWSDFSKLLL